MSVDYAGFFTAICGGSVEFILVGGTAANVHGSARLTQDVDIVYRRTRENANRLAAALAPSLTTDLGDVDVLGEITGGGGYDALFAHTVEIEAFGQRLRCLDLRKLIAVKRAAGRPKDLEAIAELEALLDETGA